MNDTIDDGDELENDGRVNYRKTPFPWFGGKSQAAPPQASAPAMPSVGDDDEAPYWEAQQ